MSNFLTLKKEAFGIEISDSSIKVLQLRRRGNIYKLVGYNITKLPEFLVVAGEIKDENKVASYIKDALTKALPRRIATPYAVCSLPENKTFVRILTIPKMSAEELQEGIKWQAEQYIPLPIDTVYLDWQLLSANNDSQKILVAAAPRKLVDSYFTTLKIAKVKPLVIDLEEAAEARALINEGKNENAVLIVDIGATKTVFVVCDQKIVPFASNTQEICGNLFTKNIADTLKIKTEDAEAKKIACCSSTLTEEEKTILKSLNPLFDSLSMHITKIIDYYHNHFKTVNLINKIILCGGGASIEGIVPHLSLKLGKTVVVANALANILSKKPLPIDNKDLLSLATVMGLAIRGSDISKYQSIKI